VKKAKETDDLSILQKLIVTEILEQMKVALILDIEGIKTGENLSFLCDESDKEEGARSC
jgi:hypothetical protein